MRSDAFLQGGNDSLSRMLPSMPGKEKAMIVSNKAAAVLFED